MCLCVVLILNIYHNLIIMSRNSGVWDCELECVVLKIARAAYVDVSNIFKAKLTFCLSTIVGQQVLEVNRCACLINEDCSFL